VAGKLNKGKLNKGKLNTAADSSDNSRRMGFPFKK